MYCYGIYHIMITIHQTLDISQLLNSAIILFQLVMEYCGAGSVTDLVKSKLLFAPSLIISWTFFINTYLLQALEAIR